MLENYFNILKAINGGTHKPEEIMYETSLSWNEFIDDFECLIGCGFISLKLSDTKETTYLITPKGIRLLHYREA